jgi:hypothetical protein
VDVEAERIIPLPPEKVAEYAMDWRHDHEWTQGIRRAELTKAGRTVEFGPGAKVTRTAYFLGKRIDYVLAVVAFEPPRLLEMKSVAGPFPMHVTYRFDDHPDGTRATIRVRGEAGGYYRIAGPFMAPLVRANLKKDLRDLQARLTS